MTKKEFEKLAAALQQGYTQITNGAERRGYNHAIHAVMQFSAGQNPKFDAVRFASAIYKNQKHRPQSGNRDL